LTNVSFNAGYNYTVKALNDPASAGGNSRAIITSTASGPNASKKVVVAYIGRGSGGLGAVYLPGDASKIETNFSGTSFSITGNDTNIDSTPGPGAPIPGISTADPTLCERECPPLLQQPGPFLGGSELASNVAQTGPAISLAGKIF